MFKYFLFLKQSFLVIYYLQYEKLIGGEIKLIGGEIKN